MRAEIVDDLLGCLRRSSGAVKNEIELALLDLVTGLHESMNVCCFDHDLKVRLVTPQPTTRIHDYSPVVVTVPANVLDVPEADTIEVRTLRRARSCAVLHFFQYPTPASQSGVRLAQKFVELAKPFTTWPAETAAKK